METLGWTHAEMLRFTFKNKNVRVVVALPHGERLMGYLTDLDDCYLSISDGDPKDASVVRMEQVLWVRPL